MSNKLNSLENALEIVESVIENSQAEQVFVNLQMSESSLSRFSENQMSQNLAKSRFNLTITSYYGQKSATSSISQNNPEAIKNALRNCETLAKLAPNDPEWIPLLPPQQYDIEINNQDQPSISPLANGQKIQQICHECDLAKVQGSGTLSSTNSLNIIGSSTGLRANSRETKADFSITAKYQDGSSWSSGSANYLDELEIMNLTAKTIERCLDSVKPQEIKPGTYPVVLESAAFANLLPWVIFSMDARSSDEGRSFMSILDNSGKLMGNRLGQEIFSKIVQVKRGFNHPLLQTSSFLEDGLPNHSIDIIKEGIPQSLSYSRYWANKQQKQATGGFFPIIMEGSNRSIQDLISQTEKGIFISRTWYVNYVNPRTLEVTGMTRDGTFWIENGQISHPIKNLRFNQELPLALKDIEDVSKPERHGNNIIPGVKIKNFHFSSITESI